MVECVRTVITSTREDEDVYNSVFEAATQLSAVSDHVLSIPRGCGRQTQRNSVPGDIPKDYFRRGIYLPFLDMMIQQLNFRFSCLAGHVTQALRLVSSEIDSVGSETIGEILEFTILFKFHSGIPIMESFMATSSRETE